MVFIFDSHPVQYKAPVYQRLQQLRPDSFKVIYATDSPVRGHLDQDFGKVVAWDLPLLDGYAHLVLNNEYGTPLSGFRSLSGRGIHRLLKQERPDAVVISQFIYAFDLTTYFCCLRLGIPIWIRQETQDEAFPRPAWKSALRALLYRAAYRPVRHAFYFGQLNRQHLVRHGIAPERMSFSPFCTPVGTMIEPSGKIQMRETIRSRLSIRSDEVVLLFSGKLIEKKNPQMILESVALLSPEEQNRLRLIFVGSGPLEQTLRRQSEQFPGRVHFAGFLNQSEIPPFYFAADILLLPSRRAGETWGLVVNEALQAGCAVIMTNAVGCHAEFGDWERVRVISEGDASACAQALRELVRLPRSFDWCSERMQVYSVDAAARALAQQIDTLAVTRANPRPLAA